MKFKDIVNKFISVYFALIGFIASKTSSRCRVRIGSVLGDFMRLVGRRRMRITLDNLTHAFPEKSPAEIYNIAKASFRNMGITLVEISAFDRFTESDFVNLVKYDNIELINQLRERNKGIILMSGHFGNWEAVAYTAGLFSGVPITIVVKRQQNGYVDNKINKFRISAGNKIVQMSQAAKPLIKALLSNEAVALLADQAAKKEKDIFVDYFSRPALTFEAPAELALRFKTPIIMGFTVRNERGTYDVHLQEVKHDDLEYCRESVRILTQRHVKMLEDMVRQYPHLWSWQHRRWKHTELANAEKTDEAK